MQRRNYLALATSLPLAGCTGTAPSEPASSSNDPAPPRSTPTAGSDTEEGTEVPDVAGTIDDFETLEPWESFGATLSADPGCSIVGTQSARIEVPAAERTGGIATAFSEPQDFTEVVPGLAVASDDLVVPWLRLIDDDGNRIDYRRGIKGGLPLARYNFGLEDVASAFDPGSVCEIHLLIWTGDGDARTVWVDDLHLVPRPETGTVMIQFDDAHVTDYTKALPRLEAYGYPAVAFVNPGRIEAGMNGTDDPGGFPRVSVDQLHELDDAGWTVANHCRGHPELSTLDATTQEREIVAGKAWLEAEGFEDGARYFAYPHGDYDERTLALVDRHHDLGFAGGRPVQGYAVNPLQVSRLGEPSAERSRAAIERTASMRGITSLLFHRLEGDRLAAFEAALEAIHEYETAGEIDVILPADLEREYRYRF